MRNAPFLARLLRDEGLSAIAVVRVLVRFYGLTVEGAKRALFGQDVANEQSWGVQCPRSGSLEGLEEFVKSLNNTHFVDIRIRSNGKYYWTDGDWIKNLVPRHNLERYSPREVRDALKKRAIADNLVEDVMAILSKEIGQTVFGKCDDCGRFQNLKTKGDHHGGTKDVCVDRDSCHRNGG